MNLTSTPALFPIGRKVGILLLLQLVAALMLPFILSGAVNAGSPAWLTAVAAVSFQVRLSVFISFAGAALTVFIGLTMFQIFRQYSNSVAIGFVVVCAVSCTLDLVHAGTIMSMLSMSNSFVAAGVVNTEIYDTIGSAMAFARRSAHIVQLLSIGAWMITFYISMFRFKLIPRWLSALGMLGVALQFTGVTLMMLLGTRVIGEMAMPLLPIHVTTAVWLLIKGFHLKKT